MPPLSSEIMIVTPVRSTMNRRATSKQRGAAALSQSMPPSLTQDEEIRALRSHLKKKRSQMPIASNSLRVSALSQRTLQNLDLDSSIENDESEDEELEELFKRKQSLSLDERIALKKEKEKEQLSSRNEHTAFHREKEGTSLVLTKIDGEGLSKKLRRIRSSNPSVETEDPSSDEETLPDSESVDSLPLLYTDPASVLSNFDKKLAAVGKSTPPSLITEQTFHKLTSFEEKIQRKLDQAAARSRSKTTSSGPRRRSISAPHPRIDKVKLREASEKAAAEKDGSSKRLDGIHRAHKSCEERTLNIAGEAEVSNSAHRRRSISAPRPGAIQVMHPADSSKEKISKSTVESMSSALESFEDRLKDKLSKGTPRSSQKNKVPKRVLPARSQSDREFGHHNPKLKVNKSRKEMRLSQSGNAGHCNTWNCQKCTYLNKSSESNETCQMCIEPRNITVEHGKDQDASRIKPPKAKEPTSASTQANGRGNLSRAYNSERMLNSRRKNFGAARRGMDVSQSVNAGSFVAKWHCTKCTYLNTAASKCCKMCLEPVKESVKGDLHWNDLGSIIDETIAMSLREK